MRRLILPSLSLLAVAAIGASEGLDARAELGGKSFYFGTHAARTNVTLVSEADLETIHGHTNELEGAVEVAPDGRLAGGRLVVPVASLKTGIDLRDQHLRGESWLDAGKHPTIELRITKATAGRSDRTWSYEGSLTIKGTTKPVKGTADVRFIPEDIAKQARLGPGAWVRVKAKLQVRLSDFGVEIPQGIGPKVSEIWDIGVDVYGTTARPRKS